MNPSTDTQKQEKNPGIFSRLKSGLAKTHNYLVAGIDNAVHGKAKVGPELWGALEETLLVSDVGFHTTNGILEKLKKGVADNRIRDNEDVYEYLKTLMIQTLEERQVIGQAPKKGPMVFLVVGINGSGKTTTIGKLAGKWKAAGKKVMLAAADTFRAAAVEQLQSWADRVDVPCIKQKSGADPSAVAFDAVQAAVARNMNVLIVDTAGRLQTNFNLMEELKKIKRVIGKVLPGAPHETLLVLDASIGQNSISQAKTFHDALTLDGLVMTKLDGTSKGGVLFNITRELNLPVRFIGIGEKMEDLQEFDAGSFVRALFDSHSLKE
ncbi:MAG: signal recognition particle-docking protein FtsY [Nitrospinota bacterium]|nr:signal recognition particle-docking protein FtsY [Nitrospinota bacterium]